MILAAFAIEACVVGVDEADVVTLLEPAFFGLAADFEDLTHGLYRSLLARIKIAGVSLKRVDRDPIVVKMLLCGSDALA